MNKISVFGSSGFIGSHWMKKYQDISFAEPRESIEPSNDDILYFRGTNSNYNVLTDLKLDINTNLLLFAQTLENTVISTKFNLISSWFCFYPKGFYSATKLCQEQLLESFSKTFARKYRILRLCNVIGGDPKSSKKKNALEFIISQLKENKDVEVYEGDNYRNYLHVDDVCDAIKLVIDKGCYNSLYNIGDEGSYKLIDIVDYCKHRIGSKSQIKIIPVPAFHSIVQVRNFFMDTSDLYDLGFKPKYNLLEALNTLL